MLSVDMFFILNKLRFDFCPCPTSLGAVAVRSVSAKLTSLFSALG
jgi:hypothetical protein